MHRLLFLGVAIVMLFGFQIERMLISMEMDQAHVEMHQKIASRKVSGPFYTFQFTQSEYSNLEWFKNGREFRWKGHMYDIISAVKTQGVVAVTVVLDKKESLLLALLEDNPDNNGTPKNSRFKQLVLFFEFDSGESFVSTEIQKHRSAVTPFPLNGHVDGIIKPPAPYGVFA
jgi:hypothetical protein